MMFLILNSKLFEKYKMIKLYNLNIEYLFLQFQITIKNINWIFKYMFETAS